MVVAFADPARYRLDKREFRRIETVCRVQLYPLTAGALHVDDAGTGQLELRIDDVSRDEAVNADQSIAIGEFEPNHARSRMGAAPRARASRTILAMTSSGDSSSVSSVTASVA